MKASQLTTGYYSPMQTDISQIIGQILPLMVIAMVFAMVIPMFKGLSREVA